MQAAFRRIDRNLMGLQRNFAAVGAFAAKAMALPAAGAIALGIGLKGALDAGGELSDLSSRTGVAAGEIQKLQQAFRNNGVSADSLGTTINRMQRALSEGTANDTLAQIGLNLADLQSMTPDAQFRAIGAAINGVEDPAQRAAAAMQIFGRSGGELLTLFADSGAMGAAADQVGTQAEIMNRNAALFDDISDKLSLAGLKTQGFFVGVADKVAPVLKPLLDGFANLDLAGMGQQFGEVIAMIIQAIADGRIGDILFTSLQVSLMNAGNLLVGIFTGAVNAFVAYFSEAVKNAALGFEILKNPAFWAGMGNALMGIGRGFIAMLLEGVAMLLERLRSIPVIGDRIGGSVESLRDRAESLRSGGQENSASAAELLAPIAAQARERMGEALANVGAAFAEGMTAEVFDASGAQAKLDAIWDEVGKSLATTSAASLAATQAEQEKAFPEDGDGIGGLATSPVSALQRIGGVSAGGTAGDPLISEARTTNSLLRDIRDGMRQRPPAGAAATFSSP